MQKTNNRVLMITHCYPPCASSGMQRTLKFSKYLAKYGWQADILTLKCKYGSKIDHGMQSEIPDSAKVFRCRIIDPLNWIINPLNGIKRYARILLHRKPSQKNPETAGIDRDNLSGQGRKGLKEQIIDFFHTPDQYRGWLWPAVITGLWIIMIRRPGIIYSSTPPPTTLLIGYYLNMLTRVKWIVDFRDPWMMQYPLGEKISRKDRISLKWEARIVQKADRIIVNTAHSHESFLHKYGDTVRDKITVITNGFDESDFSHVKEQNFKTRESAFLISHTGEFFENGQRVPDVFLRAVSELVRENTISKESFEILFLGGGEYVKMPEFKNLLKDLRLVEMVRTRDHVPHDEAVACVFGSDALLLLQNGEHFRTQIPAKTFEYLRAKKPVLAITNPGATAQILKEFHWCRVVLPDDFEGIKKAITELIQLKKKNITLSTSDTKSVKKYSRESLTKILVAEFTKLTDK